MITSLERGPTASENQSSPETKRSAKKPKTEIFVPADSCLLKHLNGSQSFFNVVDD